MSEHKFSFLWDNLPTVQFLAHMGVACLDFSRPSWAVPFHIPSNNVGGIHLLHILVSIWCCHYYYFRLLINVYWYLIVVSNRVSLMADNVEHLFNCLRATCMSSSEISLHVFFPFSNWIVCFSYYWVLRVLYIHKIIVLCWIHGLQIFFPHSVPCLSTF